MSCATPSRRNNWTRIWPSAHSPSRGAPALTRCGSWRVRRSCSGFAFLQPPYRLLASLFLGLPFQGLAFLNFRSAVRRSRAFVSAVRQPRVFVSGARRPRVFVRGARRSRTFFPHSGLSQTFVARVLVSPSFGGRDRARGDCALREGKAIEALFRWRPGPAGLLPLTRCGAAPGPCGVPFARNRV